MRDILTSRWFRYLYQPVRLRTLYTELPMLGLSQETSIDPATGGFHPTLLSTIRNVTEPLNVNGPCNLHILYSLPPSFIVDRFQLEEVRADGRLVDGQPCRKEDLFVWGERDLERPRLAVPSGGTRVLLRLPYEQASEGGEGKEITVRLPLHMRYQDPLRSQHGQFMEGLYVNLEAEGPTVFWACPRQCESAVCLPFLLHPI
jgi:hypothetical protein